MFKLKPCDLNYIKTATCYFENQIDIASPPETIFQVISLTHEYPWIPYFKSSSWLPPGIPAVGGKRKIKTAYLTVIDEIMVFEPPKRLCYWVCESSLRLHSQLASDYLLTPLSSGQTRLTWRIYCTPYPFLKLLYPLINFLLGRDFKKGCENIKAICEKKQD